MALPAISSGPFRSVLRATIVLSRTFGASLPSGYCKLSNTTPESNSPPPEPGPPNPVLGVVVLLRVMVELVIVSARPLHRFRRRTRRRCR